MQGRPRTAVKPGNGRLDGKYFLGVDPKYLFGVDPKYLFGG